MTDLQAQRVTFAFEGEVPFCWHPANAELVLATDLVGQVIRCPDADHCYSSQHMEGT